MRIYIATKCGNLDCKRSLFSGPNVQNFLLNSIIITLIYFSTKKDKLVNTHRQVNCIDQPNTNKTDKRKTKQQQYQTKCSPP